MATLKVERTNGNELYHHGVLGQRWGVRRYQNKDGSLTSEGKEHNGINESSSNRKKTTTGNSKGVKRRGNGLNGGTYMTAKRQDLNDVISTSHHMSLSANSKLKSNQIGCKVTSNAKGEKVYSLQFKDADSLNKFYSSPAGKHLLTDVAASEALAKAASRKGYLEWDESYMNSEAGESFPFGSFTNLTEEEQMNPGTIGSNEEIITDNSKIETSNHGETIDMQSAIQAGENFNNSQILATKIRTGITAAKKAIKDLSALNNPLTTSIKGIKSAKTLCDIIINKLSKK